MINLNCELRLSCSACCIFLSLRIAGWLMRKACIVTMFVDCTRLHERAFVRYYSVGEPVWATNPRSQAVMCRSLIKCLLHTYIKQHICIHNVAIVQ